jgi:hypothetical protein
MSFTTILFPFLFFSGEIWKKNENLFLLSIFLIIKEDVQTTYSSGAS